MTRESVLVTSWTDAADRYLEKCFAAATPPRVKEFAREAGVSPRSLGHAFTLERGVRVSTYLKSGCIRRAQELLLETDLPIDTIAYKAGFGTRVTFFRAFKLATGMTPEKFRAGRRRL